MTTRTLAPGCVVEAIVSTAGLTAGNHLTITDVIGDIVTAEDIDRQTHTLMRGDFRHVPDCENH